MADLVAGAVLGSRFEVVGILGQGGMATVYLVADRLRGEEVALKVLHDHLARSASMRARLRREVRTAARITNAHALVPWDLHEVDGLLAISMPVHRGQTLADRVGSRGRLDGPALATLARQIGSALAEAHRLGIVHRDVTPPNVLVDAAGTAMLTDFGLARSMHQATMTGTSVLGTAGYAAPEVYQGVRADPRSDLYSLGAVLYFAATGRPPFEAPDPVGMLQRQIAGDVRSLGEARPDLPALIVDVVDTLLDVDVRKRPADATAVLDRLDGRQWAPHARIQRALARTFPIGAHLDVEEVRRLPSLRATVRAAAFGAVVGLPPALTLGWLMVAAYLSGPWVDLPYWAPPHTAANTLLFAALGLVASLMPALGAGLAAEGRILMGPDPAHPEQGPSAVVAAGILGAAVTAFPALVLVAGTFALLFVAPPLVKLAGIPPIAWTTGQALAMTAATFLGAAFVWIGAVGVPASARRYFRADSLRPQSDAPGQQSHTYGHSAADPARAELAALAKAISDATHLPGVAARDLQSTVGRLLAEAHRLGLHLEAIERELAHTSSSGAAASVERLETSLARARTLARDGEPGDVADLERALAAELEVLAQADLVEDLFTQTTARLLELRAIAARCRLELLRDEEGEAQQRRLMERLARGLDEASQAVAELAPLPELTRIG